MGHSCWGQALPWQALPWQAIPSPAVALPATSVSCGPAPTLQMPFAAAAGPTTPRTRQAPTTQRAPGSACTCLSGELCRCRSPAGAGDVSAGAVVPFHRIRADSNVPPLGRCLHAALLEALQQEAAAQQGGGAGGQDVEMREADTGAAGGSSAAPAAGATGTRRARVTVSALTPAQQDRVVEQMVQGADIQLGLVNACIEVGAGRAGGAAHRGALGTQRMAREQGCGACWRLAMLAQSALPPTLLAGPQHLCSQQVVNYAHLRDRAHAFPWATLQLSRLHYALELWQVSFMWLY